MPSSHLVDSDAPYRTKPALWAALALALVLFALTALAVEAAPTPQGGTSAPQGGTPADQGRQLFETRCTSCHTIGGGKLVGPDLKDVAVRRDPAWIKAFVSDPAKMFAANDPTAVQLLAQNNNLKMPTLGLAPAEVDALVAYLAGANTPPVSAAKAQAASGDPAAGQRLFMGELTLNGGGPACMGCHTTAATGSLGGGSLGPDLTHVAARYGEPGLSAALTTIAFPTMAGPFTNRPLAPQEQADLVAFFVQTDRQPLAPPVPPGAITQNTWKVVGIGVVGALALFGVLAFFWPRQRQTVSARLRSRANPKPR